MKKNIVRLNESQLKRVIANRVKRMLREMEENIDDVAKKVFNSIDFDKQLEWVDADSLSWEPTGDGWYEAIDTAEFEKDGWKFEAPIEWSIQVGWMGSDLDWDFPGKQCEIKYISPDGQKGIFVI